MRYHAIVTREGNQLLAEFPDAPGCQTCTEPGKKDIVEQAAEALVGWLEAHLVEGDVPPPPRRRRPAARSGARVEAIEVPARLATRIELRAARVRLGLSQRALAARAGVKQPQIAQLEHPDSNPTVDTLEKVARALGMTLEIHLATV